MLTRPVLFVLTGAGGSESSGVDRCLPDGGDGAGLPHRTGAGSLPDGGCDGRVGHGSKGTEAGCV